MSESGSLSLGHVADGDWSQLRRNKDLLEAQAIGRGPAQARVFNDANISIGTSGTAQTLTFNSERFDTGNFHSTSSNTSRLTAPTAGLYYVGANVQFDANVTGIRRAAIQVNGSGFIADDSRKAADSGGFPTWVNVSTVYHLDATDYVEAVVQQSSGGALNVIASAARSPEFWIVRLGSQA